MSNTKQFTHNQPLGNSDSAHTGFAPSELTKTVPMMVPLMLDATSNKPTAWDGRRARATCGALAVPTDQSGIELVFYKSDSFHIEDVLWSDAVTDEHIKRNIFVDTTISIA